jgi:hypothetical protein
MFSSPGHVFGGPGGDGSRFHVLRAKTSFWLYHGRQVPFSCFQLTDTFSTIRRALGPVCMFCVPGLVFGENEVVGYCFKFCAPGVVSRVIEGVVSHFQVLRSRTRFWRYRGNRVPFSRFARPDSFSVVSRASVPVFKFCAPGLIFGGTEGVRSRFHVLRPRTRI